MTNAVVSSTRQFLAEFLNPHEEIQAAALYGSVARGDSESHSDIDLLLLCNSGCKKELYDCVNPLLAKQFQRVSLSVYSPREINFLAKAKSLFLLHLKREALLLFDRTCLLTKTLEDFEPKASYEEDYRNSLDLIAPLNTVVSESPNNLHRLSYIYSLFRIYGVYLLAEHRIFEFSKTKMASLLVDISSAQSTDVELLSKLRVLNANFFTGGEFGHDIAKSGHEQVPTLEKAVGALNRIVGRPYSLALESYEDAVDGFLDAAQCQSFRLGYRLRTWFLLLVYDGLNLYSKQNNVQELESFNAERLTEFTGPEFPRPVKDAAVESLEYLRNYPLKYFLLEDSKILLNSACNVLANLSKTVR
jgi:predicted nucleotidyltransferase